MMAPNATNVGRRATLPATARLEAAFPVAVGAAVEEASLMALVAQIFSAIAAEGESNYIF